MKVTGNRSINLHRSTDVVRSPIGDVNPMITTTIADSSLSQNNTPPPMPILGSHLSIAGGYYKAVDAARAVGCDCVQLFTNHNNQWRAEESQAPEVGRFRCGGGGRRDGH